MVNDEGKLFKDFLSDYSDSLNPNSVCPTLDVDFGGFGTRDLGLRVVNKLKTIVNTTLLTSMDPR